MIAHEPRRFTLDGGDAVTGIVTRPPPPAADTTVVLAHGAGADLHAALLAAVSDGLAEAGFVTVRFNFPYTEHRRRAPDRAPVLEACYRAVLAAIRADPTLPHRRLVAGGKSMGGRMATHLAAAGEPLDGLLLLGYPLHPPGRPTQLRAAHLGNITVPMLFLTGTRDALCDLDRLREVVVRLPTAMVYVVDDGDHSFAVRKRTGRDAASVLRELVDASVAWLRSLP